MKKKDQKIIDQLFCMAQDIEPVGKARVAAAIYYHRRVISYGICSYQTHPLQKRFGNNNQSIYLHAEINAIRNAISKMKHDPSFLEHSTLYIARAKRTKVGGKWIHGLSKPCPGCARAIAAFGIKRVIYTQE